MKHISIVVAVVACMGAHANHHQISDGANKVGIVKPRLVNGDSSRRKCFEDEKVAAYYANIQEAVAAGKATEQEASQKLKWMKKNVCTELAGKALGDAEDERVYLHELESDGCEHLGIIVHDRIPPVIEKDGHIFTFDPESRSYHAIGFHPPSESR